MQKNGISVQILEDNHRQLIRATEYAIETALEVVGQKAEGYAKMKCPVKTSTLRKSITHRVVEDAVQIGTNVEYAPHVEYGHVQEVGRYVPALGKRLVADHVKAQPYLRPAVSNHVEEYKRLCESALRSLSAGGAAGKLAGTLGSLTKLK